MSVDDDVAGEQHAEVGLGLERLVGERRVAGAEDQVRLALDSELLAQRRLYVDLAEHTEPFRLQLCSHSLDGVAKGAASSGSACSAL